MLIFLVLILNAFSGHVWFKYPKLFVQSEIGYLDQFGYGEFNGSIYCICFRLEIPFLDKFGTENKNIQFQLKLGT